MAKVASSSLSAFDSAKEKWENYQRRLNSWMRINKIQDADKVDALLAIVGAEAVELLVALCTPDPIETKTYAELCKLINEHYHTSTNELALSYQFDTRVQGPSESVSDFVVALKKLSIHCNFGDSDQIKQRLRNRLVAGVRSNVIKNKLLSEGSALTWDKALELATCMETAADSSGKMTSLASAEPQPVNKVNARSTNRRHRPAKPRRENPSCSRCKRSHEGQCPHIHSKCYKCKKIGHIARACQPQTKKHRTNYVGDDGEKDDYAGLFGVTSDKPDDGEVDVILNVNNVDLHFALDTCSRYTIIGEDIYGKHFSNVKLQVPKARLKSYSGHKITLLGQIPVSFMYLDQSYQLTLLVAKGKKTALLGRDWLRSIRYDLSNVLAVRACSLDDILNEYESVFGSDMGEIREFKAHIKMNKDTPVFHKARPVPYAMVEKVKKELDRLEQNKILRKIDHSDYASPVVVVPKANDKIRLCGDYKVSINSDMAEQPYSLPTAEDIFAKLAGGQQFSKLDLSQAYAQVQVEESSRKYLTINTVKGLYEVMRLPYGIKTAPNIFQSIMDQILAGIPGVCCYIDDILITAPSEQEHLSRLETVLQRLVKYNVRVNKDKCMFMSDKVTYLGHVLDKHGRHPMSEKTDAIKNAKSPECVDELRTFLGMVNYYGSYMENLSTVVAPLNRLLCKDTPWTWTHECQAAFEKIKSMMTSDTVLTYYDPTKPLSLACDASPFGVGAVLSHTVDGQEKPIAFASRALTKAEKGYAQIEREALGIIYGIKKFHKYLFGRKFSLITDHKPLTTILGPKNGVPTMAALRLQRWAVLLMCYDYDIQFRSSKQNANADYLSRAPVEVPTRNLESEVNYFSYVNDLPVTAAEIAEHTKKDPTLSQVYELTLNGWTDSGEIFQPYYRKRNELSCDQGCLLWGTRVVIPPALQARMLEELHVEHIGIVRMKAVARNYFWFPALDDAIENLANSCKTCLSLKKDPPVSPLFPWRYAEAPWMRVHIDFAEYRSEMYFVAVDSYSKWLEVIPMQSTTVEKTISVLREMFARNGLCQELVSDNGPQFIAHEFRVFCEQNGIKHTLTAPYHPASNGLAERAVQTLKDALKKQTLEKRQTHKFLCNFLLIYRTTPHSTTGVAPGELFYKRQLRTRLSLIKPDLRSKVRNKQESAIAYRDKGVPKLREFKRNERVRVKNSRGGNIRFVPGVIVHRSGPVNYLVRVGRNIRYVHIDHLRKSGECDDDDDDLEERLSDAVLHDYDQVQIPNTGIVNVPNVSEKVTPSKPIDHKETSVLSRDAVSPDPTSVTDSRPVAASTPVEPRKSSRIKNPPRKLMDFDCS